MYNWMLKKRNQKGFTLMEMLIVVAIIAILVAVSIPVFTSQLEKARNATDQANERAAKACAVVMYLTGTDTVAAGTAGEYKYDAVAGKLVATTATVVGYGKSTKAYTPTLATAANAAPDTVLTVKWDAAGTVEMTWG